MSAACTCTMVFLILLKQQLRRLIHYWPCLLIATNGFLKQPLSCGSGGRPVQLRWAVRSRQRDIRLWSSRITSNWTIFWAANFVLMKILPVRLRCWRQSCHRHVQRILAVAADARLGQRGASVVEAYPARAEGRRQGSSPRMGHRRGCGRWDMGGGIPAVARAVARDSPPLGGRASACALPAEAWCTVRGVFECIDRDCGSTMWIEYGWPSSRFNCCCLQTKPFRLTLYMHGLSVCETRGWELDVAAKSVRIPVAEVAASEVDVTGQACPGDVDISKWSNKHLCLVHRL